MVARMLPCVSITPLGSAVVPLVKTTSKSESRSGRGQSRELRLPIVGERLVRVGDEVFELTHLEVVEADLDRVRRVVAAIDREPFGIGSRADALDDAPGHAQVEGHDDHAGPHRAPVDAPAVEASPATR